jgi:serine/threonine-protein kinase RsbW
MADEDPLEESAEDLYENAPFGYLSTLPDGTIVKVNTTFLAWTGHRAEDIVGRRRFQDLLSTGGRIYHETHFAPLLRMQGTVREIALEVVCAGGRRLPVLVNSVLKTDAAGSPLVVRTTVLDATHRKEYERELLRARDRERAARERTERLQRLTAALASALDIKQIGTSVVRELVDGTGADRAVLAVVDDGLDVVYWHGFEPHGIDAWRSHASERGSPTSTALGSGEPLFQEEPAGAVAVIPLVLDSRPIGVLWLGFSQARAFSEEDHAFLVACAGQCTLAVGRARLREQTAEAARRSAFLARTSRALDEVQEFARRAQRLVDLVAGGYADLAWIETTEDEQRTLVAQAHRDEASRGPTAHAASESAEAQAAVRRAMAIEEPQLISETGGAPSSCVALPLRGRGRVLGALGVMRFDPRARFRSSDLPFLSELADRTGLALENARLYEHEREVAHVLQQTMLPGAPPRDPRFQVATHYRPAFVTLEVGGDWYDTFSVGEGRIGIAVGDVVGRGIQAASAMGQLRSAIRALAGADLRPARLIERLDTFVEQIETARWATLAYAEVDLTNGQVRFACAGHPPPLLIEPGSDPRFLWDGRSTPLGMCGDARAEGEITLQRGSRLLLYTDGLFERRDRSLDEGLDRLAEELSRRRALPLPTLVNELTDAMLLGEEGKDDVCLLCLSFAPSLGESGAEARAHGLVGSRA